VTGRRGGYWEGPFENPTTYLTVGSPTNPEPITIRFAQPITYFGMYVGSPDVYNSVEFFSGDMSLGSLSGDQIVNPADSQLTSARYVNFDVQGGTVNRIVMNSDKAAFETDNHAYIVHTPEPATMAIAGTALALLFFARRRR
jgi:hypothetical protein